MEQEKEIQETQEIQTVFNEDDLSILCSDDTIIENIEEGE